MYASFSQQEEEEVEVVVTDGDEDEDEGALEACALPPPALQAPLATPTALNGGVSVL